MSAIEEAFLGIMTTSSGYNTSKNIVGKAHDICNRLFLFEAIYMKEGEVLSVLESNNVIDLVVQHISGW